ncbi:MAG: hypothetical protein HYV65_00665 [Candidatus Spechtbacteria bacterium]|nr:hypothetical protein [Candidatus Spechtbacteria bacterium]
MRTRAKKSSKASASELVITPCDYDDETVHRFLKGGKAMLIGGLLALNEGANIVRVVRAIKARVAQSEEDHLSGVHGWVFIKGDPSIDGMHYIESGQGATGGNVFDIAMTSVPCFAAILNDEIAEKGANWQNLCQAIDFALEFTEKY